MGLKKPWPEITPEDKAAVMAVLDRRVLSGVHGPEAVALEAEWAAYTGSKHVLSFNSGTAAIHSALFALGVGPGDEVITSAFSFSGSFHPILEQNAIPIFADIDERTYNLDVSQVAAKITDRTKALLPVHIHGLPADMDALLALGAQHGIPVVEDACQAHGATYHGKKAGTLGAMGCFSLNVTKNLSGGEGGFLNTDDSDLAERAKMIRTFGEKVGKEKEKIRPYFSHTVGWNYRTQELPAAFARSQLKRLDHYNGIAQRNGEYLTRELAKIPGIITPYVPPDRTSIYHKYRIRFDPSAWNLNRPEVEIRNAFLAALEAEGGCGDAVARDAADVVSGLSDPRGLRQGLPVELPLLRQRDTIPSRRLPPRPASTGHVARHQRRSVSNLQPGCRAYGPLRSSHRQSRGKHRPDL